MSEFKYMEELDNKLENIKYKEKIVNIEIYLNKALQTVGYYKYSPINEKIEFINNALLTLLNYIKNIKETKKQYDKKKRIKSIVNYYNKHIINKLKETINKEPEGLNKNKLNRLDELLPRLEEEEEPEQPKPEEETKQPKPEEEPEQPKPEPESEQPKPEEEPEQPIKGINSTWTQPPLNERITRQNPDAPPTTTVSTTPIDDLTEPKQEPEEKDKEEEEEEGQQPEQQLVPVNNSQQIVQSQNENYIIAKQEIEEFKDNPQLDIIKGVGDVIEFIATSNLTDKMTDELIDQMLNMKDSHGNLLFNNRFQIEDLIKNTKKRKRLKYLLPNRIIRAEKPDEQELIINPMLRRGRIASMTSAKERYYNYI